MVASRGRVRDSAAALHDYAKVASAWRQLINVWRFISLSLKFLPGLVQPLTVLGVDYYGVQVVWAVPIGTAIELCPPGVIEYRYLAMAIGREIEEFYSWCAKEQPEVFAGRAASCSTTVVHTCDPVSRTR